MQLRLVKPVAWFRSRPQRAGQLDHERAKRRNNVGHCAEKVKVRMSSVRKAAGTVKEGAEVATALLLSQPRITGTGSSQKFDNPWPEWKVFVKHLLCFDMSLTSVPEHRTRV